jgi:hypothetical protein
MTEEKKEEEQVPEEDFAADKAEEAEVAETTKTKG